MTKNFLVSSAAAAVGVLTWACTMPVTAETVAAFYKGKTIVINMGFPGGGFFVLRFRLLFRQGRQVGFFFFALERFGFLPNSMMAD